MYVEKFIELVFSNEKFIIDYWIFLCSKVKLIDNCFLGNLIVWKMIKNCFSIIKYVRDCFVFIMFCNGEIFVILVDVFDKCRNKFLEFLKSIIV